MPSREASATIGGRCVVWFMESVQEVTAAPLMLVPLSQRLAVQEGLTTVALVGLACILFWLNARLPQAPTETQAPPED